MYRSIDLSICKLENEAILRDLLSFWTWQHEKRGKPARLLQFLNLTTSKTKQFCETSSISKCHIKNEAIRRDFLQTWKVECRADGLVPVRFAIFPVHVSKVLCLPQKSEATSYEVLQNRLSKSEYLMLQNTAPMKSAPWPPNISDEHVSCTAPFFQSPTPAIVSETASKPSRFPHFWQGAQSLAPALLNDIWTSKSGPRRSAFNTFDLEMSFAPFFDISTSKSAPNLLCLVHFDLEMCFAPQRRALFQHLNYQKWSETVSF